jgi:hypothetical protein
MDCLNLSIPAFRQMAEEFGEFKTKFLLDSYFPNKVPTFDEFLSDKDIKRALLIITPSKMMEEVSFSYGKVISEKALNIFKSKIGKLNNYNYSQNKQITYKLFNIKQQGQSDNFTWTLRKIEKPLNMEAKIERVQNKLIDFKQNQTPVAKLQELQRNHPEVAQTMLNLETDCR